LKKPATDGVDLRLRNRLRESLQGLQNADEKSLPNHLRQRTCKLFSEYCPSLLIPWKKWPQQKLVSADYPGCFALAGPTGMFGRIAEYPRSIRARDANLLLKGL